jgi:hypothetical protein
MLPAYDDGMFLPPGDYLVTWPEVVARFSGNQKRQWFCERLKVFLDRAKRCGFLKVYLFGSFISANDDPGDVDLLWVYRQNLDIDTLSKECRELLVDYGGNKAREGWDLFCCSNDSVELFMDVWRVGRPPRGQRGVVVLDLSAL